MKTFALLMVALIGCMFSSGCSDSLAATEQKSIPSFDFRKQKIVDEEIGAWKSDDGRCLLFFFTDHTVLQLYFGESQIGTWRNREVKGSKIKAIEFQESPDATSFRNAWFEGGYLFIDQGDYANVMTRMKIHRESWEKGTQ